MQPERNAMRSIFALYRYCDWHNNRRDVLEAIDCEYSERNHVTVILCKFVVLIKACGRNVNIEHNKRILIVIPFGILGLISFLLINNLKSPSHTGYIQSLTSFLSGFYLICIKDLRNLVQYQYDNRTTELISPCIQLQDYHNINYIGIRRNVVKYGAV